MDIGRRMLDVRKNGGFKQADVAVKIGISHGALVTYEKGMREPPAAVILSFGKAYNVSPAWLLTGEGRPDQASLDKIFYRSIDTAWQHLSRGANNVEKNTLIKLGGTLFQYLLEHGEISDPMIEKLLKLST